MEKALRGVQLRRFFLRGMLASLVIAAAIAIFALLVSRFTDTTGRILGTFFSLACYCALIVACASLLERRIATAVARVGVAAFSGCFALVVYAIWAPSLGWAALDIALKSLATSACVFAAWLLALPAARVVETRKAPWLGWVGQAAIAIACVLWLIGIWQFEFFDESRHWIFISGLIAFALAHVCMLLLLPLAESASRLRLGAVVLALLTAAVWSHIVWHDVQDEFFWRVLGALGIADAAASLAVIIYSRARGVDAVAKLSPELAQIELACPRCEQRQTLVAGESRCGGCGLQFKIEIQESRCAKCDYPLWRLPERRCPECRTMF